MLPDRDIETAHVPMIFGSAADDRRPGFRHDGVKSFLIRASDDVSLVDCGMDRPTPRKYRRPT